MPLKQVTLGVLACLVVSLLISLSTYPFQAVFNQPQGMLRFLAFLLRDGALIVFLFYLYRRG